MRRLQVTEDQLDEFEEKLKIELAREKEHLVLLSKN
jgi:hypothetical protein